MTIESLLIDEDLVKKPPSGLLLGTMVLVVLIFSYFLE
jgi:hypothetical protein